MKEDSQLHKQPSFLEARSKYRTKGPFDVAGSMAGANSDVIETVFPNAVNNNMNYLGTLPENYISPSPKTLKRCFKIEQSWLDNCQLKWDQFKYARGNSQGYGMYTPFCWWILNTESNSFCSGDIWKDFLEMGTQNAAKYNNLKDCQNLCEMVNHNLDCNNETEQSKKELEETVLKNPETENQDLAKDLKNKEIPRNLVNFKAGMSIRAMSKMPCYCTYGEYTDESANKKWGYRTKEKTPCKDMEIFWSMQECCKDRKHNCCWNV